jgi:aspartate racemase
MRKIGVLGGMGPEATILFQQRLLKAVRAQDDQDHIPLLIDMNPQVPSRLAYVLDQTGRCARSRSSAGGYGQAP